MSVPPTLGRGCCKRRGEEGREAAADADFRDEYLIDRDLKLV